MSTSFYVRRGENVIGPVDVPKLKELADAGKLRPTDLLAEDPAGPWQPALTQLAMRQPSPPAVVEPPPLPVIQPSKLRMIAVSIGGFLSARAARRHELKLAKLQAQASAPAAASSTVFAPQMIQTTIVRVTNKNTRGCGCLSGCSLILLAILVGMVYIAVQNWPQPSDRPSTSQTSRPDPLQR